MVNYNQVIKYVGLELFIILICGSFNFHEIMSTGLSFIMDWLFLDCLLFVCVHMDMGTVNAAVRDQRCLICWSWSYSWLEAFSMLETRFESRVRMPHIRVCCLRAFRLPQNQVYPEGQMGRAAEMEPRDGKSYAHLSYYTHTDFILL